MTKERVIKLMVQDWIEENISGMSNYDDPADMAADCAHELDIVHTDAKGYSFPNWITEMVQKEWDAHKSNVIQMF